MTITIDPVNDPPVVVDDPTMTDEDMPVTIDVTDNDSDVDGNIDPTTVTVISGPSNGTVTVDPVTGEITYIPDPDFSGMDTLVYEVCDDGSPLPVACSQATIIITVDPVEDPPVAVDDVTTTDEDTPVAIDIVGNDNDPDGNLDPTSVVITDQPDNGTITVDPLTGEVTYTPDPEFNGTDSFEYSICDSGMPSTCDTALVTITIDSVNDPPIAIDDAETTDEDVPTVIDVLNNDSDSDGTLDPGSVAVVNGPSNGTISIDPTTGEITYTPDPNFNGTDTFEYVVCDNGAPVLCDTAMVTMTVDPVDDPVLAVDDTKTTDEDVPVVVDVLDNDSDPDGPLDPSSVQVIIGPNNGTVSVDPTTGEITYTPDPNFNGVDSFDYVTCNIPVPSQNGIGIQCDTATVTITIDPVNDAPIAVDDAETTDEDVPVVVAVLNNDGDIDSNLDPSSVQVISGPSNGTVSVNPNTGDVTYTPDPNYNGTDTFEYVVCDLPMPSQNGTGVQCDTATVTITIDPVNDAPLAVDDAETTDEDVPVTIDVLNNDSDSDSNLDPSSVNVISGPSNGSISINPITGEIIYTPDPNFNGVDSFDYVVCDDGMPSQCDTATVTITIDPVNDPPIAGGDYVVTSTGIGTTIDVLVNDSDLDGFILIGSVVVVSGPSNGTATINPATGGIGYVPSPGFTGLDTLTYQICDNGMPSLCTIGTVIILVDGPGCVTACEMIPYLPAGFTMTFTFGMYPGSSPEYVFDQNGGTLTSYSDGTANITGTLINKGTAAIMWDVDIWLENKRDWGQWSALGRAAKAAQNGPYQTWDYYEWDATRSQAIGQGLAAGDTLFFRHNPPSYLYGFQVGQGANDKDGDFGASGWFLFSSASGMYQGKGDFNVDLDNCQACGTPQPPKAPKLSAVAMLEGGFNAATGTMGTQLNSLGMIPLSQPYNVAPWFYPGSESVSAIPNDSIVDWVLIEARAVAQPSLVLARQAAFLNEDGEVVGLDGTSLLEVGAIQGVDSIYLVINHRSHLAVMSATPVKPSGEVFFFDFSQDIQDIYDDPSLQNSPANIAGQNIVVMIEGDQSSDDQINSIDLGQIMKEVFMTGYRTSDVNLDGMANSLDVGRAMRNYFRRSHVPK